MYKWTNKILLKLKLQSEEEFNILATKTYFKVNKAKDKLINRVKLFDEMLHILYGPDSQIVLNWKDTLNKISIDQDRPDTNK